MNGFSKCAAVAAFRRFSADVCATGAAVGALIGVLTGGSKGAAKGAAIGAGSGLGAALLIRGEQLNIPAETILEFTLAQPLTIVK